MRYIASVYRQFYKQFNTTHVFGQRRHLQTQFTQNNNSLCNYRPSVSCFPKTNNPRTTTPLKNFSPFFLGQYRFFSSRRGSKFKLDALPFSVAPEQALAKFERWAAEQQGIRYLLSWSSVRVAASYVPVWSFDVNLRFKVGSSYQWKPSMFDEAYPNQSTIFISGLSAYSGHSYRRTLINPIHNTTLVFLGDQLQPFGNWMLRDMALSNGERREIFPDPWNATKAQAQEILRQDLSSIAKGENENVEIKMQVVSAKRVYMPTYIVDYSIFGMEYQSFLSGCDDGAGVTGVNHQLWGDTTSMPSSASFLDGVTSATQLGLRAFGPRGVTTLLVITLQFLGSIAVRLLMRLPAFALFGGVLVGVRKIIYPWMDHRYASAEWERQREREAIRGEHTGRVDDFDDIHGTARRYFEKNKTKIIRKLSGENEHHRGEYEWYKEWEDWARKQYNEQYGGQQDYHNQQQYEKYFQQQKGKAGSQQRSQQKEQGHKWDFDPNDPYSVLGIRRGALKSEISAAFRREMLKHHPDTQAGATKEDKERSEERSKYITEAYRKIKTEMK
mmetsp:Transcript_13655/g.21105  ORF Transcript_13655/g.21105 Transcript_13655/m.21105 type:complete len:556 (-) Transcript_13655:31-1698(-)